MRWRHVPVLLWKILVVKCLHLNDSWESGRQRRGGGEKVRKWSARWGTEQLGQAQIVKGLLSSFGTSFCVISVTHHNSNIHSLTWTRTYCRSYCRFDFSQPDWLHVCLPFYVCLCLCRRSSVNIPKQPTSDIHAQVLCAISGVIMGFCSAFFIKASVSVTLTRPQFVINTITYK